MREYDALGLPDDINGFLDFYELRRKTMRERLAALLGVDLRAEPANDETTESTGDEPDPGNEGL